MQRSQWESIIAYKSHGTLPEDFTSTKSNFVALCNNYELRSGILHRNSKRVLLAEEIHRAFDDLHSNSFLPPQKLTITELLNFYAEITPV